MYLETGKRQPVENGVCFEKELRLPCLITWESARELLIANVVSINSVAWNKG
jgi:hypothetical protein